MNRIAFFLAGAVVAAGLVAAAVWWPREQGVVVYCSTDEVISQPILAEFERQTGIHVKPKFDVEASKAIGLAEELRLEKDHPRCDVFWNNEILHTVRLAREGVFEPYSSPSAADIPAQFKDGGGLWTGFAARPRILVVSTDPGMWKGPDRPRSMDDFVDPKWKGRAVLAKPLAGTTLSHAVALFSVLGKDRALAWFQGLFDNECRFVVGNGPAASAVGSRQVAFGFADIDDFLAVKAKGDPVAVVYPDQEQDKPGTLLIPNTVALVRGAPDPDLGRKLIDFLLSKDVESRLASGEGAQVPLRPDVPRPSHVKVAPTDYRAMQVDWTDVAAHYDERVKQLEALWSK
jgi:iron(III) transport system substrate-binding protein